MAKIRQFVPKKEKTEENTKFADKIRRHRRTQGMKFLIIVTVIAAVVGLGYFQWKNMIYSSYTELYSAPRITAGDSISMDYNGRILTYSKDGISSVDSKGSLIWNETYQMQRPLVAVNGNAVAVGDYNGHIVYVMNETGKIGEIDTNLPIRDMAVSKTGIVAVVLEDTKLTRIHVYNAKGTELVKSECRMKQNGYPVSLALSDNGEVMAVSYLYVDSGSMKTSVAFYNFSGVGQNSIDRLVSANEYADTIFPYMGFLGKDAAFAVGDSRISFYSGAEKPVSAAEKLLSEEIRGVYRGDESVGLLYSDTTGAALYRLDVYDKKGNCILSQNIDIEFQDIILEKDYVLIYNETECAMYSMMGIQKYKGNFGKSVSLMVPTGKNNKFLMVTADSIDTIELR